jgi:hypothetical protein
MQELDGSLRQLDATIRQDLQNVTARFTPPLNPKENLGYFEYAENSFADNQGEDADDTLRFTVKAPEGRFFTGRFWPNWTGRYSIANLSQGQFAEWLRANPITVQSRYAEVIYFLRNGNLYRRVLLVAPELQSSIAAAAPPVVPATFGGLTIAPANHVQAASWLGMNDLSARPNKVDSGSGTFIQLNTLGDLTNRENRYASSRFYTDWLGYSGGTFTPGSPDGVPDDENGDSVPDYYPTLYYGAFTPTRTGLPANYPSALINEPIAPNRVAAANATDGFDRLAFPYVYPGAYSKPVIAQANAGLGWIHGPDPTNPQTTLTQLNLINHNPLDIGDSLPPPTPADLTNQPGQTGQTWWGWPTWRETLGSSWRDPGYALIAGQPDGLSPRDASVPVPTAAHLREMLPPSTTAYRVGSQPNTDQLGSALFATNNSNATVSPNLLWLQSWEDDLIMTGVRSFDVKAYDDAYGGYADLGWGADLRQYAGFLTPGTLQTATPFTLGNQHLITNADNVNVINPVFFWPPGNTGVWPPRNGVSFDLINQTMAHEGRIPPRIADGRADAQYPNWNPNVGDDSPSVVRLRRVWDTWSTDYTNAPATGVLTNPSNPLNGRQLGPPNGPPIYPSYPPPYPSALRGIQIQIRLVDPRNERPKQLTIRQDFSNRL